MPRYTDELLRRVKSRKGRDDYDLSRTKVLSDEEQLEDELPDPDDYRPLTEVYPR